MFIAWMFVSCLMDFVGCVSCWLCVLFDGCCLWFVGWWLFFVLA